MRKLVEYAEKAHKEVTFIPSVHYEKSKNVSSKTPICGNNVVLRRRSMSQLHRETAYRGEEHRDNETNEDTSNT